MTLVKCKVCKNDVVEAADRCPHCDSLGPRKSRRVTVMMIVLAVVLAIGVAWFVYNRSQEKVRTRAEVEEARRAEKIHQRIMAATFLLKTGVADPAAVQVSDIKTNGDGSVLCYQYSVKDAKGRPQKKKAVFTEGDFHHAAGSWNVYCDAKTLTDIPDKPPPIE